MCGIAGQIDFAGRPDRFVVERMCAAMEHRGPDSSGFWSDDTAALGMQRLAIIDVAGGSQPMFNEDRTVVVVMNGEIYNFPQLREELINAGHTFTSHADTEVLVHLYEEHGDRLVDRLRGMFAFAIWDTRRQRLLLARDRVGKKPLFVAQRGSRVWFASEVGALLQDPDIDRTPDPRAILSYLTLQYVPHPLSAFRSIEKVPPATTLQITADRRQARRYWSLDYQASRPVASQPQPELERQLRELLWEATRVRLLSEVPLGAYLSGGIDSSAVVAAMAEQTSQPVKTFSIGFPHASFDELRYARMIAERFSTDHHEFVVEPNALEIMPVLARAYGEPFGDPSAIPSFFLAKMTSQHVTVALNGDGGDESFAGYSRYIPRDLADRFDRLPGAMRRRGPQLMRPLGNGRDSSSPQAKIQRLAARVAMEPSLRYATAMSPFRAAMRARVLQPEFVTATDGWRPDDLIENVWHSSTATSTLERMLDADVNTYLPGDLLVKMDIASMAYSVEGRSPFLDHHLMEFAAALPADLKLKGRDGKWLLKSALRGVVPDAVLDRPKMGFGVPLAHWFRADLRELPAEMLLPAGSRVHAYVKPVEIARMIDEHRSGAADHAHRLWVLLQVEMWHREVVERPPTDRRPDLGTPSAKVRSLRA